MERISFRIWDKENKKFWFSGSTPSMLKIFFEHTAVFNTRDEMPYQQYTGLVDKNGVEIYEGDILEFVGDGKKIIPRKGSEHKWEVYWETRKARYHRRSKSGAVNALCNHLELHKVIGNIYENPELLNK